MKYVIGAIIIFFLVFIYCALKINKDLDEKKKQLKIMLGIKSPSQETIRQWELWQTLSPEEREKIAEKERQHEIELFGEELDWSFWWEDMIDDDN